MRDSRHEIIHFWFEETLPQQWFQNNPDFDKAVADRFRTQYDMAKDGLSDNWASDEEGVLALCLLLDQFPRNMFRGTAAMYATDAKALVYAKQAVHKGFDQVLEPVKRRFVYLPFMHSEHINDQRKSLELFEKMRGTDPLGYEHARKHFEIIDQYNRFPHRNEILARTSTAEEEIYLEEMAKTGRGYG